MTALLRALTADPGHATARQKVGGGFLLLVALLALCVDWSRAW